MTDSPTLSPNGDSESLTLTAANSLQDNECALRKSNPQPSDPKSVGPYNRRGTGTANQRQKATDSWQSYPLSSPPSSPDEARLEAFLVKKCCYRVYKKALRSGALVPGDCFADGPDCRGKKGNGHHHDYRYPRDVVWCCAGHHVALDRLRRSGHTLASAMVAVLLAENKPRGSCAPTPVALTSSPFCLSESTPGHAAGPDGDRNLTPGLLISIAAPSVPPARRAGGQPV